MQLKQLAQCTQQSERAANFTREARQLQIEPSG